MNNIINFNGKKYILKKLYDLIVSFPISNNEKELYSSTDYFLPFNIESKEIITGNLMKKNNNSSKKAIRLLRINEIIEIKREINTIPIGRYKVIDGEKFLWLGCKYIIKNTDTNIEYTLMITKNNNIELRNIYVYIPIEKDDILKIFIKKLSINYNSVDVIQKLWNEREKTGDYLFFGHKSHSNILRLNCGLIRGISNFPSNKNNKLKLESLKVSSDTAYLLLYLLYFNNLINYDEKIYSGILEDAFLIGDYISLDEKIINYIKTILIDFYKFNSNVFTPLKY